MISSWVTDAAFCRFLRRLVGALSAYEAAHGILTPTGGDADALGG